MSIETAIAIGGTFAIVATLIYAYAVTSFRHRHRHDWQAYGGGRMCKRCQTCGWYQCEDGSYGWER